MADTKISALPAVAAPAGADEFACNQAGVTKKETKTQITAATDASLTAHIAVTAAGVHGSATAPGANTLVHRDAAGDADATAFNAAAGAAGTPSHTFTADPNTGHYNYAADELGIATGGAHRAHWNTTGAVILNDAAASSKMTGPGVTIQQGALDDEAVAIQSSDVAHGITDHADTDTYFVTNKAEAAAGGARLSGYKDADGFAGGAIQIMGFLGENADTDKTTAAHAIVEAIGYIKSGTTIGNTNAGGNVFAVRTQRGGALVTLLIVDEDADLHVLNDIAVAGLVDTIDVANHVHTGGAMGPLLTAAGITDRTRRFFVPCVGGRNLTAGIPLEMGAIAPANLAGWILPDNKSCFGVGFSSVPEDFVSGMTVTVVVVPGGNGNVRASNSCNYGQCTEAYNLHSDSVGPSTIAVTLDDNNCILPITLANEAVGDILRVEFVRNGADVLDTVNAIVYLCGWIVAYTADS